MVNPERLIAVVEPTAAMHAVTQRVIDNVAAQLVGWTSLGLRARVAINISVRDLVDDSLVDRVTGAILAVGVLPEQIELEITEGALVRDEARIVRSGVTRCMSTEDSHRGWLPPIRQTRPHWTVSDIADGTSLRGAAAGR